MKKKISMCLALILLLGAWVSIVAAADVQEGEWEITIETEIPGMPVKMPPATYKQCISQDDPVPQSNQPGQECKTQDYKRSGNTVTWTTECDSDGNKITGQGKVTYENNQMNGTMTMTMQGVQMKSILSGHRIGDCKK